METPYDANESIPIAGTTVKLVDGPACTAQVVLKLSPVPTIHFDLVDLSGEFQRALFDSFLKQHPMVFELPSGENVHVFDGKQSLIPTSGRVTALHAGKPMHAVRFGVVNFPDFKKPRATAPQTDAESPWNIQDLRTLDLEGSPWLVEVRPIGNRKEVSESLRRQSAFALTHWGLVTRIDDKPFPRESVKPFMATLNRFLSFARGVTCRMALVRGLDESGETAWEEWGVTKVQPWMGHKSCLDIHHGHYIPVYP